MSVRTNILIASALAAGALAFATPAHACAVPDISGYCTAAFESETREVRGVGFAVGAGWAPASDAQLGLELGYGWGQQVTGVFGSRKLRTLSVRADTYVDLADDDTATAVDIAGLYGIQRDDLIGTYSLGAGASLRVAGDTGAGPIVRGSVGLANSLALTGSIAAHFSTRGADVVGYLGLEVRRF